MKKFLRFVYVYVVPWLPVVAYVSFAFLQEFTRLLPLLDEQLHLGLFRKVESLDFDSLIRNILITYTLYLIAEVCNLMKTFRYQKYVLTDRGKRLAKAHRVVLIILVFLIISTPLTPLTAVGAFISPFEGWFSLLAFLFSGLIFSVPILDWMIRREQKRAVGL